MLHPVDVSSIKGAVGSITWDIVIQIGDQIL